MLSAGDEDIMGKVERWLGGRLKDIRAFIDGLYGYDLHAKRVDSLAGATLGVMTSASLAVAVIGQALAQSRGLVTKHAIKQVDRLLSNQNIDVWDSFARWVPHLIGQRKEIIVAMDWTDFDGDGQATLALNLVTGHGRATPLLWLTVWKDELTEQRNDFEDACLMRLKELVPAGCAITILADRGFGDHKLFKFLDDLDFGYVIRFRGNIHVTDATGETRPAAEWVGKSGRARKLRGAEVTASHAYKVGAVVCVHAKAMKEPWCLATSNAEAPTAMLVNHYAKRWTIEPNFRDTKDLRFGMGLSATRIGEPTRRDRLLLINAFAMVLLTMLGAAGESLGMDRLLKSNTSKTRTHSLFRQGCMLYELIPTMPDQRLFPLMARFAETVSKCQSFSGLFEVI
jgi:Transposase DDE domain